jgi:Flp pilus assembly pilin Flp
MDMLKFGSIIDVFHDDEWKAKMIEYAVMMCLITVALLLIIGAVATQIEGDWAAIREAMKAT